MRVEEKIDSDNVYNENQVEGSVTVGQLRQRITDHYLQSGLSERQSSTKATKITRHLGDHLTYNTGGFKGKKANYWYFIDWQVPLKLNTYS